MSNEIQIRIGGDPSGFNKAARDAAQSTDRLRNSLKDAAGAMPGFNNAAAAAGATLTNKVAPGANQATNAMLNLGRIVQDAPFGFIGIANNINPLLESFQRLKAETGSTGGALKALGASLAGGAGLGLAVSLLTSGLTLFAMSAHGAKEGLKGFAKAIDEANKQAGEEIARVQVLSAVISDTTRKQTERSGAAKELSGILKGLNEDMSQEAILNGQVAEATKRATEAIISRAKARAVEARIGELTSEQLQRDLKRSELTDKLTAAQKKYNEQLANRNKITNKDQAEAAGIDQFLSVGDIGSIRKAIDDLDKQTSQANKEISFLINQIKGNDLTIETKGSEKEVDLLKQRITALKEIQSLQGLDAKQRVELVQLEIKLINRDGPKLGFSPEEINKQADALLEQAFPVKTFEFDTIITTRVNKLDFSAVKDAEAFTENFKTNIAAAVGAEGKPLEIPAPNIQFTAVKDKAQIAIDDFNKTVNNLIQENIVNAGVAIGETLGQVIAGSANMGDAFSALGQVLSGALQALGQALLAYGAALLAFQIASKSLNPVVAFVAGALAIAAGQAVKESLPKFAEGGIATRATLGIFGEAGPEAIMPLNKMPGLMEDSLRNILPDMLGRINVNNQNDHGLLPTVRISLTDLELGLERVRSQRRRLG